MSSKVLEEKGFNRFKQKENGMKNMGYNLNRMLRTSDTSSSSSCHVSGNANDGDHREPVNPDLFTFCDDASFSSTNLSVLNTPYLDQQTGALDLRNTLQTPVENLMQSYNSFAYSHQDFLDNDDLGIGGGDIGKFVEAENVNLSNSQQTLFNSRVPFNMQPSMNMKNINVLESSINLDDHSITLSSLLNYEQQQQQPSEGFDHHQNYMSTNYGGIYNIPGNASGYNNSDGLFMGSMPNLQTMPYLGTDQLPNFNGNGHGLYGGEADQPQITYNQNDLHQVFCDSGSNGLDTTSTPSLPTTDISGLDDAYKVGKLTSEEKKLKIKKYMKKRNERNFNKTIKYACRKTLADSRPRVRGRFAKNEEITEVKKENSSTLKEEVIVVTQPLVIPEVNITTDTIFGDMNNTYKYNYTLDGWN